MKRRRLLTGFIIAAAIGIASSLAFSAHLFYSLDLRSGDLLFRAARAAGETGSSPIVLVAIDDSSLAKLGHFPSWDRSRYARVVDSLAQAGARVIVFDILFAEPAPGDAELAAAIQKAGNVVLPVVYRPATTISAGGRFLRPLKTLEEGAARTGHAGVLPDADGVVRKIIIASPGDGAGEPALALAAVAQYLRRPPVWEGAPGDDGLSFAGRVIPLSEGAMNISFPPVAVEGGTAFPAVSFADVLEGKTDGALFRDRLVIIGATATGTGDVFWTPPGRRMSGVEVQAAAAHTILSGDFLRTAPSWLTVAAVLLSALLCGLAVLRLRVLWATLSALFLLLAYLLLAFRAFDGGLVLNMLYPPLAMAGSFAGLSLYNVTTERAEKHELARTFGRYVSPAVAGRILEALRRGELTLESEEREVTVAFADMRGFTGLAEKASPPEVMEVLNGYLSAIIEAFLRHGGMINKFGGDSVMAVWNAPVSSEEHALQAVRAALEAQRAIHDLPPKEGTLRMEFGIGINTGKAVAGNLGTADRLEYSVIGDTVNTAARLAGAAPGGRVWVGADTFTRVKEQVSARALELLTVKGKQEPVLAYEILDMAGNSPSPLRGEAR